MAPELGHGVESKVTGRDLSQVKVLVEPFLWRREYACLLPGYYHFLMALFPNDGVAFSAGDDNDPPRAMAVSFLVGFCWEDRHVSGYFGTRQSDLHTVAARPSGL